MKISISLRPFSLALTGGHETRGYVRLFVFLIGWNNGGLFNVLAMVLDNAPHTPMSWARCYLRLKQYRPVRWQRVTHGTPPAHDQAGVSK